MNAASLHDWFQQPLGAYLLERERAWLDHVVPDIFGYHALQLGLPRLELLRESRIVHRVTLAPGGCDQPGQVAAQFHELPFDEQSVDLCVMPHVLEFTDKPHEILREVDRVMRPEGRILITGFNPWSLFGVRKLWAAQGYPWQGQFVSLVRMRDWLQLLGFEPSAGRLTCYIPPCETEAWQRRWQFLEKAGDRWWGVSGGVYMVEAIKRVQGMRIITPTWAEANAKERKFAAAANHRGASTPDLRELAEAVKNSTHLRLVK